MTTFIIYLLCQITFPFLDYPLSHHHATNRMALWINLSQRIWKLSASPTMENPQLHTELRLFCAQSFVFCIPNIPSCLLILKLSIWEPKNTITWERKILSPKTKLFYITHRRRKLFKLVKTFRLLNLSPD